MVAGDSLAPQTRYAAGRGCDGCTMCCKLLTVTELSKPSMRWCEHCDKGSGCRIYLNRPAECARFVCGYLRDPNLGEHWRPSKCRMVVADRPDLKQLLIFVDAQRPLAWRDEPYLSDIRRWSAAAARDRGLVIVWQGTDAVAIHPLGEKNLGPLAPDLRISVEERLLPDGRRSVDFRPLAPDGSAAQAPPASTAAPSR